MASFNDLVQKTFYLGVGLASYAGEKAGSTLKELRGQTQKIVDEMVARGEITTEEAQRLVNEMLTRAQQPPTGSAPAAGSTSEPRSIEIIDDDSPDTDPAADLRRQVEDLRTELNQLKRQ